jgi:hypothetical protein
MGLRTDADKGTPERQGPINHLRRNEMSPRLSIQMEGQPYDRIPSDGKCECDVRAGEAAPRLL